MNTLQVNYPRRRLLRTILHTLSRFVFWLITDLEINGLENIPESGPYIVVSNHFSFADPAAIVRVKHWQVEFVGGFVNPSAPPLVKIIPRLWGYYPVYRGTASRLALQAAEQVISKGGILFIAPEAGNWATVLRPARPGTAFIAARTGAKILPIGLDGLTEIFDELKAGRRAKVTINIGEPFGPFKTTGKGQERRSQLDDIGHEVMRQISCLIPPERRGHYSDDPAVREAARGTEVYPWADTTETEFRTGELRGNKK